jgi:nickel-type superoxide dismutase maturation protease
MTAGRRGRIVAALAIAGVAVLVGGPAGPPLDRLRRSWPHRVAVAGDSMAPTLRPGDWVLVDPDAFRVQPPAVGDVVVVPDPRLGERWLIKRVGAVDLVGWLELAGDLPERSTDSRTFGAVDPVTVLGRPWLRYWPPQRLGRID